MEKITLKSWTLETSSYKKEESKRSGSKMGTNILFIKILLESPHLQGTQILVFFLTLVITINHARI